MYSLSYKRVTLMVILHQHLQTLKRHPQIVGKFFRISHFRLKNIWSFSLHLVFHFSHLLCRFGLEFAIISSLHVTLGVSGASFPRLYKLPLIDLILIIFRLDILPLALHLLMQ